MAKLCYVIHVLIKCVTTSIFTYVTTVAISSILKHLTTRHSNYVHKLHTTNYQPVYCHVLSKNFVRQQTL